MYSSDPGSWLANRRRFGNSSRAHEWDTPRRAAYQILSDFIPLQVQRHHSSPTLGTWLRTDGRTGAIRLYRSDLIFDTTTATR